MSTQTSTAATFRVSALLKALRVMWKAAGPALLFIVVNMVVQAGLTYIDTQSGFSASFLIGLIVSAIMAMSLYAVLTACALHAVGPATSTVMARVREPGSMVASNNAVYSLSLRDPLYVRAYVSEPDLGRIAPGSPVRVYSDSSNRVYRGQIGFISPRAEFTPKTVETTDLRTDLVYRLRVVIADADEGLRQGMPVTVEVALERGGERRDGP